MFVEIHHLEGVLNWEELYKVVREYLLCSPDKMKTLCVECHEKMENNKNNERD